MTAASMAAGDAPPGPGRVWTPRPWREESRRADLRRVGRFAHEHALRDVGVDLSPGAHHVVSVLASYGNENGANIFPSQETLARVCRRSVRHVRAKLRELTEFGLVRRLSHGGGRPSHRGGRTRRVTPARYELTFPTSLTDEHPPAGGGGAGECHRTPKPTGATTGVAPRERPAHEPPTPASAARPAATPGQASTPGRVEPDGELSSPVVEQIREALGVRTLTEPQAEAAIAAAVARTSGAVSNRLSYALAVIRSDPAGFRPTPDVTEPDCPAHPGHPTTRCPYCAAARSGPTAAWERMRAALRQSRAP